jgi:hypothetical protein
MKATLLADGRLMLMSSIETRIIEPTHKGYARVMQMYADAVALSPADAVALSASAPAAFTPAPPRRRAQPCEQFEPGRGGFPWMAGTPEPAVVYDLPVKFASIDPERLRFGVGRLDGNLDPYRIGILSVWKDPESGKTFVVDGVSRLEWAQYEGLQSVPVVYLTDAESAEDAQAARIRLNEHRGLRGVA